MCMTRFVRKLKYSYKAFPSRGTNLNIVLPVQSVCVMVIRINHAPFR